MTNPAPAPCPKCKHESHNGHCWKVVGGCVGVPIECYCDYTAPAPQPDLHERIAEMFPCICIPPFEDGAHFYDCPTGFRKEVEELVCELERERDEAREKLAAVILLLDTPEIEEFDKAVPLESAHQIKRWGNDHDAGKLPADWFWLVGYLAGKALHSHISGNVEKAKHHCISTAAALRNWHAHIRSGETKMRPGIETPALGAESPRKDAAEGQ